MNETARQRLDYDDDHGIEPLLDEHLRGSTWQFILGLAVVCAVFWIIGSLAGLGFLR
jgi:hypothetical protein